MQLRSTPHRWTMRHTASNTTITCTGLRGVEAIWRELCRMQRAIDACARKVAWWIEAGDHAEGDISRAWLASGYPAIPDELVDVLSALPKPGEPRHWFRHSADLMVSPPGGHDLLGLVRAQLARLQKQRLERMPAADGWQGQRQRL